MNLRTPSYFTVSHTRRTGGVVANSYSSRSCVWGVTARSILYAIRNGARRCRTPLDTGAPTKARSHIPLSSHFVSNEWLSLSATGRTRPSRPASTRCPPIADASSTRRRVRDQASACRRSSFFPPNAAHPPDRLVLLGERPLSPNHLLRPPQSPSSHSSLATGPRGTLTRRRLRSRVE
jgi:hypothetical protein